MNECNLYIRALIAIAPNILPYEALPRLSSPLIFFLKLFLDVPDFVMEIWLESVNTMLSKSFCLI